MPFRRSLLALAAAALAVPASALAADRIVAGASDVRLPGLVTGGAPLLGAALTPAHEHAVDRHADLAARRHELMGSRLPAGHQARVADWSLPRLLDDNRRLKRSVDRLERAAARRAERASARRAERERAPATPAHLQAIAACESGGDPRAVSSGGQYRGKYQFDRQTWQGVGGSGDPAAASEAEQDRRAAILYAQAGASPWPVCGR